MAEAAEVLKREPIPQTRLKEARLARGWSREKAARQIDMGDKALAAITWASYEDGHRIPSLPVAFKIARLLGVTVDELFIYP